VVLTAIAMWLHLDVRTVGDMGKLPDSLPVFLVPDIPLNLDTLLIILPHRSLAVVGLLESMMTATIVDDMTDTPVIKTGNARLRASPISAPHLSGMAGCAMIGQSVINVWRSGPSVHPHCRCGPAVYGSLPQGPGLANPYGRAGRRDDHGFDWYLFMAFSYRP
jgi:MFS superfamily sulfate permease-like transporter